MQILRDTMKRENLQIVGIEKGSEFYAKETRNIFNKIIEEKFPVMKKEMPINILKSIQSIFQ